MTHPPEQGAAATPRGRYLLTVLLAALGVVCGDIGTSPLYAMRECFHGPHAVAPTPANVLGVLSLIFWSLLFVISLKYLIFIMRADNRGEGGMAVWREKLFAFMSRNARRATIYFSIPPEQVIEVGTQVEL